MKLFRWLGVGCVATAGLVLAFAAGVWVTRPAEPVVTEQAKQPAPPTKQMISTAKKDEYMPLPPSEKPAPPIHPANDPPREVPIPLPVVPLPAPEVKAVPLVLPDLPASSLPRPEMPVAPITPVQGVVPVPVVPESAAKPLPVRYVNKPDLELEYALNKQGKSGVKSVSLFVRDPSAGSETASEQKDGPAVPGRQWFAVSTENAAKLQYTMAKDGRYEFRLGVTSGNGNESRPKETDPPDLVVVYDTTPPTLAAFEARVDAARNAVTFRIELSDINLDNMSQAVVEYRGPGGEWRALKMERMTWAIPADAPAEAAFRLTVTDLAGNAASKVIEKVNLDTTVPEGRLTKVRTVEPPKKEERLVPLIDEKK